ncbi:MAG: PA2169 family four-helix-bundle protein [Bdellovibrionales bacterium]|nr:PA2169 family four-helix-bundle protein [Ramlibacter sp.]
MNRDPISNEPGAHPIGTGLGAAAGGAVAGAAAGALAGPAGALVGAIAGAVVGGLGGKAAAEAVNPTAEEAYWRGTFRNESYYEQGRTFDDYGPAYRLGWGGRDSYSGDFDAVEPSLAADWETRRDGSSLSWPQARAATRAAWNRIDQSQSTPNSSVDNDDTIDTLNEVLENCRDGEYGFRASAEHTKAQDVKTLFLRHADECRAAAAELAAEIRRLGGTTDEGGTAGGSLHRGWVAVRGTLTGYSDLAMLEECERGEDVSLGRYRSALKQELPAGIKAMLERQMQGAQRNHDLVKALRDTLRAAK